MGHRVKSNMGAPREDLPLVNGHNILTSLVQNGDSTTGGNHIPRRVQIRRKAT
jgi:hypothetical protein